MAGISSVVAFILILIGLRLIIGSIAKSPQQSNKGFWYAVFQILSVASGFFKGAFFTSVLLLLISQSSLQDNLNSQIAQSTLYSPIADFSKHVVRIISDKVPNIKPLLDKTSSKDDKTSSDESS